MALSGVLYENETKYTDLNISLYNQFFDELYKHIGFSLDDFVPVQFSDNIFERFAYVRYLILTYLTEYKVYFYNLLKNYGYFMELEVIDTLISLSKLEKNQIDEEVKTFVKKSPFIQNLKINVDKIQVISKNFGTFDLISAKSYFKDNRDLFTLLSYGDFSHRCHDLSLCILNSVDNVNIVTSLMPCSFKGTYYHTYIEDSNGFVIDGANNIVLPKEQYDILFKPKKVIDYKRSDFYKDYVDSVSDGRIKTSDSFYLPLALALTKGIK